MLYSVKMRSAQGGPHEQGGRHISGAERILSEEKIEQAIIAMLHRAQKHQRRPARRGPRPRSTFFSHGA